MSPGRRGIEGPALADEKVPIVLACRLVGIQVPDIAPGRAVKVHCPFGELYHRDGGIEPAMRVYVDSNRVHCFAGCGTFHPVKLVAHAFDIPRRAAARELLDRVGIRSTTREQRWRELRHPAAEPLDRSLLAEALKTFLRRTVPNWDTVQYEPAHARLLGDCLALLDRVTNDEEATRWLIGCKRILTSALAPTAHHR